MANSQLIAYASAQLDKGVPREAIAQALVGAGWQQADVDAAITEVMAQRASAPAETLSVAPVTASPTAVAETQPVMTSPVAEAAAPVTATAPETAATTAPLTPSFFATTPSLSMDEASATPKRSPWLLIVLGIALALAIIGAVAYVLMGGTPAPASNPDELATLQQENAQLKATVATLTENQSKMESELAFFVSTTTPSVTSSVAGRLSTTDAGAWILTTAHNIVITVSNAKEAALAAALPPFKDAEVTLTGTHAPGSTLLRVTAINGTVIQSVTAAAATTTTSTPPGTR